MRLRLPRRRKGPARDYARSPHPAPQTPWREAAFAVVDLELTGLDPRADEIISFASVPVDGGRVVPGATRALEVRPRRMPDETTIRIHGLRPVDLADAPPLEEAIEPMLDAIAGRVLVAHPAWVEREFLAAALATIGGKLKEPVIDTAALARRVLGRDEERQVPLAEAVDALGLPAHDPHTASGDALTTAQLFIALATRLERTEPQTVGSLARLSG
jgi:DNA polymerase III subunit epsilon